MGTTRLGTAAALITAATMTAAAAGCSTAPAGRPGPSRSLPGLGAPAPTPVATSVGMRDAQLAVEELITVSDLPPGWAEVGTVRELQPPEGGGLARGHLDKVASCEGLPTGPIVDYPPEAASPNFDNPEAQRGTSVNGSSAIAESVQVYPSAEVAQANFAIYPNPRSVDCLQSALSGALFSADPRRTVGSPTPLTLPEVKAAAWGVTVPESLNVNGTVVTLIQSSFVVRKGRSIAFFVAEGYPLDRANLARAVAASLARIPDSGAPTPTTGPPAAPADSAAPPADRFSLDRCLQQSNSPAAQRSGTTGLDPQQAAVCTLDALVAGDVGHYARWSTDDRAVQPLENNLKGDTLGHVFCGPADSQPPRGDPAGDSTRWGTECHATVSGASGQVPVILWVDSTPAAGGFVFASSLAAAP